jgi:predicted HicB family RNase H-like nuclease
VGTASTKAKNKYNDANYDRINLAIKKGMKDKWKEAAAKQGKSLNQFIIDCVEQGLD